MSFAAPLHPKIMHQGGLTDNPDECDSKMFEVPNSKHCPVKTLERFLKHLNPKSQPACSVSTTKRSVNKVPATKRRNVVLKFPRR